MSAVSTVLSFNFRMKLRQGPFQALSVFQSYWYRPLSKTSPSLLEVDVAAPVGLPVAHATGCDFGYPAARMPSPKLPPMPKLTGSVLPAVRVVVPPLAIGGPKPVHVL